MLSKGTTALVMALRECTRLRELDISGNAIGKDGAEVVAASFGSWPRLGTLKLSMNQLEDEGAMALAARLKEEAPLLTFILFFEESIIDSLPVQVGLRNLRLDSNRIKEKDTCQSINHSLTQLINSQ